MSTLHCITPYNQHIHIILQHINHQVTSMSSVTTTSPKPSLSQLSSNNPTLWRQYVNKENQSSNKLSNQHRPTDSFSFGWSQPGSPTSPTDRPHKRALQRSWASMVANSILPGMDTIHSVAVYVLYCIL